MGNRKGEGGVTQERTAAAYINLTNYSSRWGQVSRRKEQLGEIHSNIILASEGVCGVNNGL